MTELIRAVIPDTQEPPLVVLDEGGRLPERLYDRRDGTQEQVLNALATKATGKFLDVDYRLSNGHPNDETIDHVLVYQTKRLRVGSVLAAGFRWGELPDGLTLHK